MASHYRVVDDFCRLCAIESQSGVIIYSAEGENLCLEEKIINCLRIEVSRDDLLPKRVCQSCNTLLEDYYRFLERATQVQQTLYFLLGLNFPQVQNQESQLCFLEESVKLESNAIKKELDDVIIQQGNLTVEGERFDLLIAREDVGSTEHTLSYDMRSAIRLEEVGEIEINGDLTLMNDLVEESVERKQTNRKRKPEPKKPVSNVIENNVNDIEFIENNVNEVQFIENNVNEVQFIENNVNEVEFILEQNGVDQNYCKPHVFSDKHSFSGNEEVIYSDSSSEDDEEHEKLFLEWKKQWGILCDQCQNNFTERPVFDKHYRFSHNKQPVYMCSFCKKSMEKHSAYKLHILQHISEGRFKCRFCDKKFCSKEMLKIHSTTVHTQQEIFICEECGMSFTSQSRLDSHLTKKKNKPSNELQCKVCGKILQTKSGLAAHKLAHERSRPFMCHICGKTFTQKINMQQHVKHHKGERPHVCDICGKGFAEKSHLNRHKSFHREERPFQCPVCKKMYKTERCLKVHSQIHWNSRPYICSICGKGFLSSTKLKQHYNCHTGERPYACKYCERTFTNYPNWLKHTRRRHQVDHKTGLGLKTSEVPAALPVDTTTAIEFVEMPELEVKEDGSDGVRSLNAEEWIQAVQQPLDNQADQINLVSFQEFSTVSR